MERETRRYLADVFKDLKELNEGISKVMDQLASLRSLIALAILGGIAALVYFKWYKPHAQREAHHKG